jgi:hypothetical protein
MRPLSLYETRPNEIPWVDIDKFSAETEYILGDGIFFLLKPVTVGVAIICSDVTYYGTFALASVQDYVRIETRWSDVEIDDGEYEDSPYDVEVIDVVLCRGNATEEDSLTLKDHSLWSFAAN